MIHSKEIDYHIAILVLLGLHETVHIISDSRVTIKDGRALIFSLDNEPLNVRVSLNQFKKQSYNHLLDEEVFDDKG